MVGLINKIVAKDREVGNTTINTGRIASDQNRSVAIYSDTIVVGAYYQDYDVNGLNSSNNAGAAYIFTRSGTTWTQQQKIRM